jgi:hypothetical protein
MGKTRTTVYLDESSISLAKFYQINVSAVCQNALDIELKVKAGSLDATVESMKDLALVRLEEIEQVKAHLIIKREGGRQKILEMMTHIDSAVAAGRYRGEAETDYGEVFPEGLWEQCGGKQGRAPI